jgi:nitroimidazol reductase NimA-like FMN-containing flavoprotein (pyridoxamine 5'-phosphate oxidase superfamily)
MFIRISEAESRSLLSTLQVGRLGCVVDGGPYVVPINFYFEDDCVYAHSLQGLKISALRQNPRACIQADVVSGGTQWRSVLAYGNYEEIIKPGERHQILSNLLLKFPLLTPVESAIVEDAGPLSVIVFRIRINRISGVAEE